MHLQKPEATDEAELEALSTIVNRGSYQLVLKEFR